MKKFDEFSRPYLVQRFKEPFAPATPAVRAGSFEMAFGGGGSGMTKEGREWLMSILSPDYMGSAEFEFGALPKCLHDMTTEDMVSMEIDVLGEKVWVLGPRDVIDEYVCYIKRWGAEKGRSLKESTFFADHLRGVEWAKKITAWLDIEFGVFWTVDKERFDLFSQPFDVRYPKETKR